MGKFGFAALGLGVFAVVATACGSTVVYEDDGAGGSGAAPTNPTGPGPSKGSTKAVTTKSTTYAGPTNVSTGPGPTTYQGSAVYTVGTGMDCDSSFDCNACQECSFRGPCAAAVDECVSGTPECLDLLDCLNACGNDQACTDECGNQYPAGIEPYLNLVNCVICEACYFSCDGQSSGC